MLRWLVRIAIGVFAVAVAGAGWLAWKLEDRLDLAPWAERWALPAAAADAPLTVSYLGVATLLFDDGETQLMTDGWFTRVGLWDLVRRTPVSPDTEAIAAGLDAAGVTRLAAVFPVHSHYDHAQDSPEVARRTGAKLLGSETTAWIGRGAGLPEDRIVVVEPEVPLRFGRFWVTFIPSRHVPLPGGGLGDTLDAALVPPVPVSAYPEGGAWSILVEHPEGTALVQGSAGFVTGALDNYRAHVVFLGVGLLDAQGAAYTERYLREVVDAVDARRVVPIHFEDLTRPARPPTAFGDLLDDLEATFERLRSRAEADPELSVGWLPVGVPVAVFEGRR
jgi:L-ascorbate metabolism protein UlaG (beta-lactamase superfamily)